MASTSMKLTHIHDGRMTNESKVEMAGAVGEVWWTALRLGLTSFGGLIAHLGYFERTYVRERRWISSEDYTGLVAPCQLLPGPTSSQDGFFMEACSSALFADGNEHTTIQLFRQ
jgi:hypothetical protein